MWPEGLGAAFAARLSQGSAIRPASSKRKMSKAICPPIPAKLYTVCSKGTDVVDGGPHGSGSEAGDAAPESVPAGAISEVVMGIPFCQQGASSFGIAGSESVDEGRGSLDLCHDGLPCFSTRAGLM